MGIEYILYKSRLLIKIEDQGRNINSIYAINQATSVLTNSKTAKNRHTVFKA